MLLFKITYRNKHNTYNNINIVKIKSILKFYHEIFYNIIKNNM